MSVEPEYGIMVFQCNNTSCKLSVMCMCACMYMCTCICHHRVSHDRGKCFHKFPLDTTGQFVLKGLVSDFMLGSLVGLAFGVPSHANNTSEWIVHAIKFSQALDRPCKL